MLMATICRPSRVSRNSASDGTDSWRGHDWGTPIDGFPFPIEETAEAPKRLADIYGDVLSLAGPGIATPPRRQSPWPPARLPPWRRTETDCNDRIVSVGKVSVPPLSESRQSNVFQGLIDAGVKSKSELRAGMCERGLESLGDRSVAVPLQ
jgi:hypothetical protein